MDEEMVSMISNDGIKLMAESSDSKSSSNPCWLNKHQRHDSTFSSPRYKGVVLQQNGHWGAQMYANQQRIWLGTFKSDKEAAMAYDIAVIKLRTSNSNRNFPWIELTIQESSFQNFHTTEAVLNMIKDESYQSKLTDCVRNRSLRLEDKAGSKSNMKRGHANEGGFLCEQLFQKELTPSDVGKLNRLAIPRKHATKYFSKVCKVSLEDVTGVDEVQLVFFDRQMRSWKFRYCYWKSSQSFVFTRGWSPFVKEKELKAKDIITFHRCEYREGFKEKSTFYMIDVLCNGCDSNVGFIEDFDENVGLKNELELGLGQVSESGFDGNRKKCDEEEKILMRLLPTQQVENEGVRLFGVHIS